MTDGIRTCATCACSVLIEPPKLADPNNPAAHLAKAVRICRRNPPATIQFVQRQVDARGGPPREVPVQGLAQQPTADELVCFDGWRPLGTLPGERYGSGVPTGNP